MAAVASFRERSERSGPERVPATFRMGANQRSCQLRPKHLRRAHSVGTSPGRAADGAAAPAQQQTVAQPAGGRKRQRSRDHPPTGGSGATSLAASKNQAQANLTKLEALSKRFPGKITVTAPHAAVPLELKLAAQRAASLPDLDARVFLRHGRAISVPQWDETRTWDPGD